MAAGSSSRTISPTDGDARLISAMIAGPSRGRQRGAKRTPLARAGRRALAAPPRAARALRRRREPWPSRRRVCRACRSRCELLDALAAQGVERCACGAAGDGGPGAFHAVVDVRRCARDDERERGVERDEVGARRSLAGRGSPSATAAFARASPPRIASSGACTPYSSGSQHASGACRRHRTARRTSAPRRRSRRGRWPNARRLPPSPPSSCSASASSTKCRSSATPTTCTVRAGRIGQRAENVEDRAHAELACAPARPRASPDGDGCANRKAMHASRSRRADASGIAFEFARPALRARRRCRTCSRPRGCRVWRPECRSRPRPARPRSKC